MNESTVTSRHADPKRKFWRTLAGVMMVQVVAMALLWLLQAMYGI